MSARTTTLFCLFYFALVFLSIIYFHRRLTFIKDALGSDFQFPYILQFAAFMHTPIILALVLVVPCMLLFAVWLSEPNAKLIVSQAVMMVVIILFAFVPCVATEITTSSILSGMHEEAKRRGLID